MVGSRRRVFRAGNRGPGNVRRKRWAVWFAWWGALAAIGVAGCSTFAPQTADFPLAPVPRHDRPWQPNLARLPEAEIDGDIVTIRNVRNTLYLSADEYVPRYRTDRYDLRQLASVDLLICPFDAAPALAHTMLSFGFDDGRYLALSIEARLEKGESYSASIGALDQFELIYILADERDPILLRTKYRRDPVYLYPLNLSRDECRRVFLSVLEEVNHLAEVPQFYHTLNNNCTTGIVAHLTAARPTPAALDPRLVLTGWIDRVLYDYGWIDQGVSYEAARRAADITDRANRYADHPDFSLKIRKRRPRAAGSRRSRSRAGGRFGDGQPGKVMVDQFEEPGGRRGLRDGTPE